MDPQHAQMLEHLTAMEETLTRIVTLLETMAHLLEQTAPEVPAGFDGLAVPIATYEQLYGPIETAPEPLLAMAPPSTPLGRLRRFLWREH